MDTQLKCEAQTDYADAVLDGSEQAGSGCCGWSGRPRKQQGASAVYRHFAQWSRGRVWAQLHRVIRDELGARGELDWSRCAIDSVSVRAANRPRKAAIDSPPGEGGGAGSGAVASRPQPARPERPGASVAGPMSSSPTVQVRPSHGWPLAAGRSRSARPARWPLSALWCGRHTAGTQPRYSGPAALCSARPGCGERADACLRGVSPPHRRAVSLELACIRAAASPCAGSTSWSVLSKNSPAGCDHRLPAPVCPVRLGHGQTQHGGVGCHQDLAVHCGCRGTSRT